MCCLSITVTTILNPSFSFNNLNYINSSGLPNFLVTFFSSFPVFFYFLIENRINYKEGSGYNAFANANTLSGFTPDYPKGSGLFQYEGTKVVG
jgi:hypothetical protein